MTLRELATKITELADKADVKRASVGDCCPEIQQACHLECDALYALCVAHCNLHQLIDACCPHNGK